MDKQALFLLTLLSAVSMTLANDWDDGGRQTIKGGLELWGTWHNWEFCSSGMYVYGMQLRTEKKQGSDDDTALNSVRLFCAPLGKYEQYSKISSYDGIWGDWGAIYSCRHSLMNGLEMRSEDKQGSGDDTAANNVRMVCSNDQVIEGDGLDFGNWQPRQTCAKGYAVCGISALFEANQGKDDDTALNAVQLACCKVKQSICQAEDTWVSVLRCDNSQSDIPLSCSYSREVGTEISSSEEKTLREEQQLQYSVTAGVEVGGDIYGFKASFSQTLGTSRTTGFDWSTENTKTFSTKTTAQASFEVPARRIKTLQQVAGSCGSAFVSANSFRSVDDNTPGFGGSVNIKVKVAGKTGGSAFKQVAVGLATIPTVVAKPAVPGIPVDRF